MITVTTQQIGFFLFVLPVAALFLFVVWGLCYYLGREIYRGTQGKEVFCAIRSDADCPGETNARDCKRYRFNDETSYYARTYCDRYLLKETHPTLWEELNTEWEAKQHANPH